MRRFQPLRSSLLLTLLLAALTGCDDTMSDDDATSDDDSVGPADADGDGWTVAEGDCDDESPGTHPGAAELCDGEDNDCDGTLPADEADLDGDGGLGCEDCDDSDPVIGPHAEELCDDGLDNDCDGSADAGDPDGCVVCTYRVPAGVSSIEDALAAADDGDTVCVDPGTYLTVLEYGGKSIALVGVGGRFVTVLHGNAGTTVVSFLDGEGSDAVLRGFTITNGQGTSGGGIAVVGASPTLASLTVESNWAAQHGGGIYLEDSSATATDLTVSGNTAVGEGGGMHVHRSSPVIQGAVFSGNEAGSAGGGLFARESDVEVSGISLESNIGSLAGGGLALLDSSARLNDVLVEGNHCTSHYCSGCGVYLRWTDADIGNLSVIGNTCSLFGMGAGLLSSDSSPTMDQVVVTGNSGAGEGGGVYLIGGEPVLRHVMIAGNRADAAHNNARGGGLYLWETSPTLTNVLITANAASATGGTNYSSGGGIEAWYSDPSFVNATVTGNQADNASEVDVFQGHPTFLNSNVIHVDDGTSSPTAMAAQYSQPGVEYCNVWADSGGAYGGTMSDPTGTSGNLSLDPAFLDPTHATPHGWVFLSTSSPLIDAGDPALLDPDGSRSDIGAYGGPGAAGWDLDGDGYPAWWQAGPYDHASYPAQGWDCHDDNPSVFPGSGC